VGIQYFYSIKQYIDQTFNFKPKKMKHVKLFESFRGERNSMSEVSLIEVSGDWSGITKNGKPDPFILPSSVNIRYYPNPTPDQIKTAFDQSTLSPSQFDFFLSNVSRTAEEVTDNIMQTDQSGSYIYQDNPLYLLVSSDVSPREIKNGLEDFLVDYESIEPEYCQDILDASEFRMYNPGFISHCEYLVNGKGRKMERIVNLDIVR
jgi:hypothetical protein